MKEREYPVHVREYAKAMRKVDPSIKIIACGSTHEMEFQPVWLKFPEDKDWKPRPTNKVNPKRWTKALLKQARGSFDYLAPHIYTNGDSVDPIENGKSLFANIDESERLIYEQIQWIQEEKSPVRLAQTEWMINWHFLPELKDTFKSMGTMSKENYDKLTYGNSPSDAFISLLGSADFLGKLVATGYVDMAVSHSMYYNLAIAWDAQTRKPIDPVVPKPAGLATEFWSQLKDQQFVPVRLANVPTYTYKDYTGKDKKIPLMTAYATTRDNKLNIILINRSPDQSLQVAVPTTLKGKPAKSATEYAIFADSWGANVYPAIHDPSKYPFKNSTQPVSANTLSSYELKPCKLIRLEITF
jgi:alpha-L-arabinofuranosidase